MALLAGSCESLEALDRLRTRRSGELAALKRARPDLYAGIGDSFAARFAELSRRVQEEPDAPARDTVDA